MTVSPPTAHIRMGFGACPRAKTLIVSADVKGILPAPYRFGSIEITPPTVTAEGRAEKLAPVGSLTTQPIDVSGATTDIVRRVEPIVPAGVTLTPRGPITVTIHILAPAVPQTPIASPPSGTPETAKP